MENRICKIVITRLESMFIPFSYNRVQCVTATLFRGTASSRIRKTISDNTTLIDAIVCIGYIIQLTV